ncbi:flagellar motor switch protein FliN [Buchnera aphidicola (Kurisakia onigurumii)]|uniref:flagellar motor switch protein FliN n=1 Tax=Buchnera aphidicola TaxID=9 RepID=UPI0031B72BC1
MQDKNLNVEKEKSIQNKENLNENEIIHETEENNTSKNQDEDILKIKNEFENISKNFIENESKTDKIKLKDKKKYKNNFKNFKILEEVPVNIVVELGKKKIKIKDLLKLKTGSILTLNKVVGEELNILINNHLIAKGEIVVTEEQYGIRITHIQE